MDWSVIEQAIADAVGTAFHIEQKHSVGGGSINAAYQVSDGHQTYFVKLNSVAHADMFEAEFQGLQELAKPDVIRVPRPLCWGTQDDRTYFVSEYLSLSGRGSENGAALLGENLAALHKVQQEKFGWFRDNTIGSTRQVNTPSKSWAEFYADRRLRFQFQLAGQKGRDKRLLDQGEKLCEGLGAFFESYQPKASLLHGDLWSGNYAFTSDNEPVIFDPAVYYGDREADIAMTELFGGFPAAFYQAYNAVYPLDSDYKVRKDLYNLYHVLNHFNLFGGGYYNQAQTLLQRLLSCI